MNALKRKEGLMKKIMILPAILILLALLAPEPVSASTPVFTSRDSLPADTDYDQVEVTINQEEGSRTYTVYRQGGTNETDLYPPYIAGHGCATCSAASIIGAYTGRKLEPAQLVESVEKEVFGQEKWEKNYSKKFEKQMPLSLYGVSRLLDYYGVAHKYVRSFEDQEAVREITDHLKAGKPVIVLFSSINRNEKKHKGSVGYHTITFLGLTDEEEVIIGEPGGSGRIRFSTVDQMIPLLFPCKDEESEACYFSGRKKSGGYILVGTEEEEE